MERDLNTMNIIQMEKEKEIKAEAQQALNDEGVDMAEHKRFTLDIVDTPADPLR
jgi:hypothetical protein